MPAGARIRRLWKPAAALLLVAVAAIPLLSRRPPIQVPDLTAGVRETRLSNGLVVLTKALPGSAVVSVGAWYRVGRRNETRGAAGIAHLLEHMLFERVGGFQPGEIQRVLVARGASYNGITSADTTRYTTTLPAAGLSLVLGIEAARMARAHFDPVDLAREKRVVRNEDEGAHNDPNALLMDAVERTAYPDHPYGWATAHDAEALDRLTTKDLDEFYHRYYGPNNAVLVIVGGVQPEASLQEVQRRFGSLPPVALPADSVIAATPQREERQVAVRGAGVTPVVALAYRGPPDGSPDLPALHVLREILVGGESGRMYTALSGRSLTTRVQAVFPTRRDPYLLTLRATAQRGVTSDRLSAALLGLVDGLKRAPPSNGETDRAKRMLLGSLIYASDGASAQAYGLGSGAAGAGWRELSRYPSQVNSVTSSDLQRVARKYLARENLTLSTFLPTGGAPGETVTDAEAPEVPEPPLRAKRRREAASSASEGVEAPNLESRVTRFTLANGVRVIVCENRASPSFVLRAALPAGGLFEPPNRPGLALLTAVTLRNTRRRRGVDFVKRLNGAGAGLGVRPDLGPRPGRRPGPRPRLFGGDADPAGLPPR